jgi:hypothetical protein
MACLSICHSGGISLIVMVTVFPSQERPLPQAHPRHRAPAADTAFCCILSPPASTHFPLDCEAPGASLTLALLLLLLFYNAGLNLI